MTKICYKCGEEQGINCFSFKRAGDPSAGLQAWCKSCLTIYKRDRRIKKSVSQIVFERHQKEANKQDHYEAMKKLPPIS